MPEGERPRHPVAALADPDASFKALRKAASVEDGAIGFIEEIDAIGGRRGGFDGGSDGPVSSGTGGVVNELLVQLQSFDTPPLGERAAGRAGRSGPGRVGSPPEVS